MSTPVLTLTQIPLDQLAPHPDNVRRHLGDLAELIKSIDGTGILEPLLVLPPVDGVHLVVAGHRRLAAALIAKDVTDAPCVIRDLTPAEVIEAMLVENLQRAEITPIEEALAYARLVELGTTATQIAKKVGRSTNHVKGRLALTALPAELLDRVEAHKLTLEQAAEIAAHADDDDAITWVTTQIVGSTDNELTWFRPGSHMTRYITDRDQTAALAAEQAKLDKAGLTRFAPPRGWYMPSSLTLTGPTKVDLLELDTAARRAHAKEPCHQVHLIVKTPDTGGDLKVERIPICTTPVRHTTAPDPGDRSDLQIPTPGDGYDDGDGDTVPAAPPAATGTAAAERAAEYVAAEQRRKARDDAATARAKFTRTYATSTPTGLPEFFATAILEDVAQYYEQTELAEIAGCPPEAVDLVDEIWEAALNGGTATERDPWLWAWGFSQAERSSTQRPDRIGDGIRGPASFVAYLRFLATVGYELSDYETGFIAEYDAAQRRAETPDIDAMELDDDTHEVLAFWGQCLAKASDPETWAAGLDTVPASIIEDLKLRGLAEVSTDGNVGSARPTPLGRTVATAIHTSTVPAA